MKYVTGLLVALLNLIAFTMSAQSSHADVPIYCQPTITGLKWIQMPIRYRVIDGELRDVINKAIGIWHSPGLSFIEDKTAESSIWLDYLSGPSGVTYVAANQEIAGIYAFTIRIDRSLSESERQSVMVHELGHAIGLGHPNPLCSDSIMGFGAWDSKLYPGDIMIRDRMYPATHQSFFPLLLH